MNLYIRYFDKETLVTNVDDAIAFLRNIDEIGMNPVLEAEIREYVSSEVFYPKRYKVRPRIYFIIIKTDASTMADFKEKRAVHVSQALLSPAERVVSPVIAKLNEQLYGWYEGSIDFKRVSLVPGTGKFQYRDCYNRIIDYLREHVDNRSQFPSVKGKNFKYQFLGFCKQTS